MQKYWPRRVRPARLDRLANHATVADGECESVAVEAPFVGQEIGRVPDCGEAEVAAAVERARDARPAWADWPVERRAEVVDRFHDLVLDRQAELLDVMQLESGKARRDAFEEVLDVAITARHYSHRAADYLEPERRKGAFPAVTRTEVAHHPVGVVGLISPWNYPLTLAVSDAVPALLAGNAVVLNPATQTSFTALLAAQLLREAGVPEDVFQVVTGRGSSAGAALVDHVDFIGFTGSTETGRVVARQAGENLIESSLELGGKNPMVVLADADLDRAVEGAVQGCFANAGQLCISFERIYVEDEVYPRFVSRLARRTRELRLGPEYDFNVEMGSLFSADQLETVEAHVADAREKGANVVVGGEARPELGPYFYEPTVLTDVTPEMAVSDEETFGPVVSVYRVADAEEAVERANESSYGLNASVWTGDADRGRAIARDIRCGTVNVNDAYIAAWASVDAPMGGMQDSGLGRRHGEQGFFKYTEPQTVAVQRGVPLWPPRWLPGDWYAKGMTGLVRLMDRIPGLR